jgi:plasmid stability protein
MIGHDWGAYGVILDLDSKESELSPTMLGAIMEPDQNHERPMPNLSIKNVPEEVVARLRARARANHRSLQGELLDLACRAARGNELTPASERHLRGEPDGQKTIEQIAAEHKARRQQPVSDEPLSAELIRRERDAR